MIQFNFNPGKLFPFLVKDFSIDDSPYNCEIDSKLIENDVSCITISSLIINVVFLIMLLIVKIIVIIPVFLAGKTSIFGYKIWNFKSSEIKTEQINYDTGKLKEVKISIAMKIISKINKKMDLSCYFCIIKSMEIDLFLNSWASIKSLTQLDFWSISSNLILLFFIINNIVYSIFMIRIFLLYILPRKRNKVEVQGILKTEN